MKFTTIQINAMLAIGALTIIAIAAMITGVGGLEHIISGCVGAIAGAATTFAGTRNGDD